MNKKFFDVLMLSPAKAWHEILLEDAEQFSRKLKEKELKNNNNHED